MSGKGTKSLCKITILALGLALSLLSCGISTTAYLYSPLTFSVTQADISISNDGANYEPSEGSNQTFLGIDIYYRIFQNRPDAVIVHEQLISAGDRYDGNPDAFMDSTETSGFYHMRKASNSAQPSVTIAANDYSLHTISTTSWKFDDSVQLVRNISRPENSFPEKNFDAGDQDYKGNASIGGTFYMVLFAVSYGQDTIGAPVYSDPVVATSILQF